MQILDEYVFYASPDFWAGNPFLLRLSSGRLILGFRRKEGGKLIADWDSDLRPMYVLGDSPEDLVRGEPRFLVDRPGPITPAFFELPNGSLLAWHNEWKSFRYGSPEGQAALKDPKNAPFVKFRGEDPRSLGLDDGAPDNVFGVLQPIPVLSSDDAGETWRDWGTIYGDPEHRTGCGFRGNMIQLDAATVGIALNDGQFMVSTDEGRTWSARGRIGPTSGETSVYRKPDGGLAAFIRSNATRSLHATCSNDDGRTWDATQDTGIQGCNPFFVLPHSSGKTLLFWGRRDAPRGVKAKVLRPDLSDLLDAPEHWVDEYREPTSSGGYPAAAELGDGTCLVAYYARSKPYGPSEIHGRLVAVPDH